MSFFKKYLFLVGGISYFFWISTLSASLKFDGEVTYQTRAKMNQENLEETNENLHYLNADFYVENMFSRSSKAIVSFSSEQLWHLSLKILSNNVQ